MSQAKSKRLNRITQQGLAYLTGILAVRLKMKIEVSQSGAGRLEYRVR